MGVVTCDADDTRLGQIGNFVVDISLAAKILGKSSQ